MNSRILQIKNRTTGLYAKNSEDASKWAEKGKMWTQLTHVYSHIQCAKLNRFEEYLDSDIVEFINWKEVVIESISDHIIKDIGQIISELQNKVNSCNNSYFRESYKQELQRKLNKAVEIKTNERNRNNQ